MAIGAGVGMFIAFCGFQSAGLIQKSDSTLVTVGDLSNPGTVLALAGIAITAVLVIRQVKGGILIGILLVTVLGLFVKDPVTGSAVYPKREKQQKKYERLTPKQLIEQGWTVRVRVQPDYDKDAYGGSRLRRRQQAQRIRQARNWGRPETIPLDAADVKGCARSGETIVFELTPPDDANDSEFLKHESLLSAFWDNVRADG